jgi:hypothetical protein
MPIQKITSGIIQDGAVAAADIVSVSNTAITGNIISSQITSVANTQITGNIASSQITSNPTLYGNVSVTGVIGVGGATPTTNGSGITFPATQSASSDANTLDDYEEGTWTPVWSPATTNFSAITYAADTGGRYTKIGRMVYVQFFIQVSSYSGGSGLLRLQGFPFSTDGVSNQQSGVTVHLAGSWGTNTPYSLDLGGTSANAKYRTAVNGTIDNGNLAVTDMATNCFVRACFCYQAS